jgi:hypothetical protein
LRSQARGFLFLFPLAMVGVARVVAAQSATPANPPGIPEEYLATPAGWSHPACIIEVGEDQQIDANGNIALRSDGSLVRALSPCPYPHYSHTGISSSPGSISFPEIGDTWVIDGSADTGSMSFLSANWTVPSNPAMVSGQILYFFPGFLPKSRNTSDELLQPVLGWNTLSTGPSWTISSWRFSTRDGLTYNSRLIAVGEGQALVGSIAGNDCSGGVCNLISIYTAVAGGSPSTTLVTNSLGESLMFSLGGVYERYYVTECSQGSQSESITFSNIYLQNAAGQVITPTWKEDYWAPNPACNAAFGSPSSSTVTLSWCVPHNPCTPSTCGQTLSDGCGGQVICPACCRLPNVQCGCGLGCVNVNVCHRDCP